MFARINAVAQGDKTYQYLQILESIGLSELNIDGQVMRLVSGGGRDAKQILSALKIKEINPPDPRKNHGKDSQNANIAINSKSSSYFTRTYKPN
jgi:hypothetical protein